MSNPTPVHAAPHPSADRDTGTPAGLGGYLVEYVLAEEPKGWTGCMCEANLSRGWA